jgi:predicted house-cleaning noncanonical NTP pyrophosphatase (MazG superfamily)
MGYTKLIRDRVPEIMKSKGIISVNHIAGDDEYEKALLEKLKEEVEEFVEDSCYEEMADIMEVIYAILKRKNFTLDKLEKVRKKKLKERGGFDKKIIAHID